MLAVLIKYCPFLFLLFSVVRCCKNLTKIVVFCPPFFHKPELMLGLLGPSAQKLFYLPDHFENQASRACSRQQVFQFYVLEEAWRVLQASNYLDFNIVVNSSLGTFGLSLVHLVFVWWYRWIYVC